jgi:hypothetical protein
MRVEQLVEDVNVTDSARTVSVGGRGSKRGRRLLLREYSRISS